MILIIHAHPYPSRSRATHALLQAALTLPEVKVHSLYERYPDFDIDIAAEQAALTNAHLTVWLHPLYWYSVPGMMKHYFDKVLALGWAYGGKNDVAENDHDHDHGRGRALHGKHCLWAPSTGGDGEAYSATGIHANAFAEFVTPVETTARFCGMFWQPPFVVHGAHVISNEELAVKAGEFKGRLKDWIDVHGTNFTAREAA
jgi:glutathione-regulated potassium-efflux system ancillary protein KefF